MTQLSQILYRIPDRL